MPTYLVDDLVQDHVLVDLERVSEHVLPHGGALDLAQRHRLLLDVVLVVAHLTDRQRVHLVFVHQLAEVPDYAGVGLREEIGIYMIEMEFILDGT